MNVYTLDWETFYDSKDGYTLKKMTVEEYLNDPRFHAFGFSIKKGDGETKWIPEGKIKETLSNLDLGNSMVASHNAAFDMAILNWKYGVKPKLIIDTLSMARILLGPTERIGLAALAERFGLGQKGTAIVQMDGIRHPSDELAEAFGKYAINDSDLCWGIFKAMKPAFTVEEIKAIDFTIRMFTEPSFVLDPAPIERELALADERRDTLLTQANCTLEELRSDDKFAELLISLGVEPPKKISAKKSAKAGKTVYAWAFAKSDADFKALGQSEDDLVRFAVEARLGLKSTIKQSRSERFAGIQKRMGVMPVALDYAGANTHRYAASSWAKVNMQNLPALRGSTDKDAALLRKSLIAPDGKLVAVSDLAQIEARVLVWLAGEDEVVESFRLGNDVYSEMASVIFGRKVDRKKVESDFIAGFIGKTVVLGCGYGLGHIKFGGMIYSGMLGMKGIVFDSEMAYALNADVKSYVYYVQQDDEMVARVKETKPAAMSLAQWFIHLACAKHIIDMFRASRPKIKQYWNQGQQMLECMYTGEEVEFGILKTGREKLILPNGMTMHFKGIEYNDREYSCIRRKEGRNQRVKLYGGKVVENICQAISGAFIKHAGVAMADIGFRPILQVHDEYAALISEKNAAEEAAAIEECMVKLPSWGVGLPLAAETSYAKSYGEAK